jgi:hypothetical protein
MCKSRHSAGYRLSLLPKDASNRRDFLDLTSIQARVEQRYSQKTSSFVEYVAFACGTNVLWAEVKTLLTIVLRLLNYCPVFYFFCLVFSRVE